MTSTCGAELFFHFSLSCFKTLRNKCTFLKGAYMHHFLHKYFQSKMSIITEIRTTLIGCLYCNVACSRIYRPMWTSRRCRKQKIFKDKRRSTDDLLVGKKNVLPGARMWVFGLFVANLSHSTLSASAQKVLQSEKENH